MTLSTSVQVNDQQVFIIFSGGITQPERRNGIFQTNDPDLIKAIESDSSFGVLFEKIFPLQDDVIKVVKPNETNPINPEIPEDLSGYQLVNGITSGQKARAWMLANKEEISSSDLRTNKDIRSKAEDLKIRFIDWIEE